VHLLAFNCGSSSLKCAVLEAESGRRTFELQVENIGRDDPQLVIGDTRQSLVARRDLAGAIDLVLMELRKRWTDLGKIDAVVHRVVHGGERFTAPTVVDAGVLTQLAELEHLAPLHNPPAIRAIRGTRELFANVPHVAVFDTAFHSTLPPRAREYALPDEIRTRFGIRRYGFHGISHKRTYDSLTSLSYRRSKKRAKPIRRY